MNWNFLVIAGLFEVVFAFCLGKAKEATRSEIYWWYAGFLVALTISMALLMKATQSLPIGTANAIWTGIGAVGTVLVGIIVFKEPATFYSTALHYNANWFYYRTKSGFALNYYHFKEIQGQ